MLAKCPRVCKIQDVKWITGVLILLVCFLNTATAQLIDTQRTAQKNFAQCQQFFLKLGDPITAESQCKNAVQYAPEIAAYHRLYARVLLELGKYPEAQTSLNEARTRGIAPEDDAIEAELAYRQNDFERTIAAATRVVSPQPDINLRALRVKGLAQKRLSRFDEALETFKRAVQTVPTDVSVRRELAALYQKSEPRKALAVLTESAQQPPLLLADLGRLQWINGDLTSAINTLEKVAARPKDFSRDRDTQQKALGALAYSYFGQGRFAEGQKVMSQMDSKDSWFGVFISKSLPWLLALVLLLVLHLIGEARIEPLSTIEIQDGPRPWTVGTMYVWLLVSCLSGMVGALFVGNVLYGNFLAIFTPYQMGVAQDVFFIVTTLVLLLLSLQSAKTNGWNVPQILFGKPNETSIAEGILAGLVLTALTIGYQYGTRLIGWTSFFTDTLNWRVSMILLIAIVPLAEVFFRAFALYPLNKRYGTIIGSSIAVTIFALAFGAPIPLLLLHGAVLVFIANRAQSTVPSMAAQLIYLIALFSVVMFLPIVRNWF